MIDAYPRVEDLAQASRLHLEQVFQWLGLVKRARFIREAAEIVAEQYRGEIPRSLQELKQLPGIGDYSANAILCFGFGQANPVVDSATARVLKRLLGFRTQKKPGKIRSPGQLRTNFLIKRIQLNTTIR